MNPEMRKIFFENVELNGLETLKENFNIAVKQQENNSFKIN